MKVSNYQCFFRELKSPVSKRQADFSMRRIQSLTRTCPVIAQVFFKFPTQRSFHHENILIISGIFPFQNEARYNTEESANVYQKSIVDTFTELVFTTVEHQIPRAHILTR